MVFDASASYDAAAFTTGFSPVFSGRDDSRRDSGHTVLPGTQAPHRQHTLGRAVSCSGIGLHSGRAVTLTLCPAEPGSGLTFRRTDLPQSAPIAISWEAVKDSRLCTVVGGPDGASVATIEHLLAALAALEVDNALLLVDGPEVPAMDGSSAAFVALIESAGLCEQAAPRRALRVLAPVEVAAGPASARLEPVAAGAPDGLEIDFEIDFAAAAIGRQACVFAVTPASFKAQIMRARTFGLVDDLPKMREMGLGLGGSLDNAVVVDGDRVLNEGGLRYPNEFVRHKALDAIGDLALAGLPILGRYVGRRASHALNGALVKTLLATPGACAVVDLPASRRVVAAA